MSSAQLELALLTNEVKPRGSGAAVKPDRRHAEANAQEPMT